MSAVLAVEINGVTVTPALIGWAVFAAVVGYLIGSINPAAIIARARGIDLHAQGSGNPGATNAARVMGKGTGVLVGVIDILKGFVPVMVFGALLIPSIGALSGFAAIIGHMTSPFLRGKGGKGVATTVGVLLAAEPLWVIPVLIVFVIVKLTLKQTGLASVAGALTLIVVALIDRASPLDSMFGVLVGILVIVRHQRNLRAAIVDFQQRHEQSVPPPT